jgi:hypothetical protein
VLRQSLILGLTEFGWHALSLPRAWFDFNSHALRKASERATLKLELDDPLVLKAGR